MRVQKRFIAPVASLFGALWATAANVALAVADETASSSSQTTTTLWYSQWWVWAVGIAVFLIIIIALTNRGGKSA